MGHIKMLINAICLRNIPQIRLQKHIILCTEPRTPKRKRKESLFNK